MWLAKEAHVGETESILAGCSVSMFVGVPEQRTARARYGQTWRAARVGAGAPWAENSAPMTAKSDLRKPLSDGEHSRLETFLQATAQQGDGVLFAEACGLLTAVVSSPGIVSVNDWLSTLIGENHQFESHEEAEEILGLLVRLYNQISDSLRRRTFAPHGYPNPESLRLWCRGYLKGVRLDPEWYSQESDLAVLFPLAVLSGEHSIEGERDELGAPLDPEVEKARLIQQLPQLVVAVHDRWLEYRRERIDDGAQPVRVRMKVGRHGICSCGSGKQYRKCCGLN